MITDWLHALDAWMLAPVAVAFVCALVLTVTRRRWDPQEPGWRLRRAIIICAAMSAWPIAGRIYEPAGGSMFALQGGMAQSTLGLASYVVGAAILLGWLILWIIEGRSLVAMGWVRHRAVRYLLGGLALGAILGSVLYSRQLADALAPDLVVPERGLRLLPLLPWHFVVSCVVIGLTTGWAEENVFRGHLMPALAERGHSLRRANLLQALVFSLYHVPGLLSGSKVATACERWGVAVGVLTALVLACGWFVWGLIFGLMRRRTGSIVLGFAFHSAYDAAWILFALGPTIAHTAQLLKGLP